MLKVDYILILEDTSEAFNSIVHLKVLYRQLTYTGFLVEF